MKKSSIIALGIFCSLNLLSQVTVTMDLPTKVAKNKELDVNLKISKGPIRNYSKYEMTVPEGFKVKEIDSKYGAFTFQNNKVRIIWAITPSEPIYTITIKLTTGSEIGARQISQTYAYAEKGEKLELEMATVFFTVVDSVENKPASTADTVSNATPAIAATTEEVNKEVEQLKVNSAEGMEIADRERKAAQIKLAEANLAIQEAEKITDQQKKKEALEIANENKSNAEADIANADKIMSLSKSLNENAVEIEKLNQPVDTAVTKEENKAAATVAVQAPAATVTAAETSPVSTPTVTEIAAVAVSTAETSSTPPTPTGTETVSVSTNSNESNTSATKNNDVAVNNEPPKETVAATPTLVPNQVIAETPTVASSQPTVADVHDIKIEHATETAITKGEQGARGLYKPLKADEAHTPMEIRMQVSQLRLDSKDAKEVGTREKLKAEKELADAFSEAKKAQAIHDPAKKKIALDAAAELKEQAQYDLEIATKILALSKSLADNANEIEKLHLSELQSLENQDAQANASKAETTKEFVVVENKKTPTIVEAKPVLAEAETKKAVEKTVVAKTSKVNEDSKKEKTATENSRAESSSSNSGEFAFTLQLGSFLNNPDLSQFKKLGKVDLKTENGKFKVFYGKFTSKQEATEMRFKTVARGFDCFVVSLKK